MAEPDREAVLLRYFERKSAREIAQILGLSDEAAQKRVSRAVERLREYFARHGVTVGAGGLVAIIGANAVQAAPVGLAVTVTTAALTTTTLATAATAIATKAIAMTTLQKTLIATTLAAAVGTGIYEAWQASVLREQNHTLQEQQGPLGEQIEQLNKDRDEGTRQLAALREQNARLNSNTAELLRLRGEVGLLRRNQSAASRTSETPPPKTEAPTNRESLPEDIGRELGMALSEVNPAHCKGCWSWRKLNMKVSIRILRG